MDVEHVEEQMEAIPALGHYPYPRPNISMGTTLIAAEYADGVILGTDSRTSAGSFIASRATDKITPITEHIVCQRAGTAADTQAIADIVNYYVEVYSLMESEPVSVHRTAQLFRQLLYNYRDQLSGAVIVSGWDEQEGAQIYSIPMGGFVTRQHFASSGSGSGFVMGYMDQKWKPNMNFEEVKDLVRTSVGLATMRDGSSGGVIRLAIVNKNGTVREVIRPDSSKFPSVHEPKPYSHFPKHIAEKGKPKA